MLEQLPLLASILLPLITFFPSIHL
jgi:hypothetical protein